MVWQHLRAFGATARPRTGQEWVAAIDLADAQRLTVAAGLVGSAPAE